jgi:hypothetical protein
LASTGIDAIIRVIMASVSGSLIAAGLAAPGQLTGLASPGLAAEAGVADEAAQAASAGAITKAKDIRNLPDFTDQSPAVT